MESPYEILGVSTDATKEQIANAYRQRARKAHPDLGGDSEEFKKITRAREVLMGDERRKRFDETGDTGHRSKAAASAAEAMVAGMVQEAFMQSAKPPVRWMCDQIDRKRSNTTVVVEQAKGLREKLAIKIAKFEKDNKATKNKQGLELIIGVLQAGMANLNYSIAGAEADIATCTEALALLNDLRSQAEGGPFGSMRQPAGFGPTGSLWIPTT